MSRQRRRPGDSSSIDAAIATLRSDGASPATVQQLADISLDNARRLRGGWRSLDRDTRLAAVSHMAARADDDVRMNFERTLMVAVADDDPDVRLAATNALWECESTALLDLLLSSVRKEPVDFVRAALVTALARFARACAEGRHDARRGRELRQLLVDLASSETREPVRLAALTAAAYLGPVEPHDARDDPIAGLIEDAFDNGHDEERIAAVRAMGRYGGSRWSTRVIDALRAGDDELRAEAASAAPYVEDQRVLPYVFEAAEDQDDLVPEGAGTTLQMAAIAALGEIGGEDVRRFLRELRETSTGALADAADDALSNAGLSDGLAAVRFG